VKVDVVILSYNTLLLTQSVLSALRATAPGARVVVVDNGSEDGSAEWLGSTDGADGTDGMGVGDLTDGVILNGENLGFAKACNRGAWTGEREIIVFLNTDIQLVEGWLEGLLAAFDDEESVMAGNQLVRANGNYQRYDFIAGACCAVRRDWFTEVGGYDERFFFGYEDVDLSWQARLNGKRIVTVKEPRLVHLGAASHTEATAVYVREARELFRRKWDMPILRFRGGGRFLIGVPARDLSVEDLMGIQEWTMAELVASGLYEKVRPKKEESRIKKISRAQAVEGESGIGRMSASKAAASKIKQGVKDVRTV